jgi:hypothetical protein
MTHGSGRPCDAPSRAAPALVPPCPVRPVRIVVRPAPAVTRRFVLARNIVCPIGATFLRLRPMFRVNPRLWRIYERAVTDGDPGISEIPGRRKRAVMCPRAQAGAAM